MKAQIAKILCLFTALLLGSNIVLASNPQDGTNVVRTSSSAPKIKELLIGTIDVESSVLNFVLEKDPFEDLEIIADFPFQEVGLLTSLSFEPRIKGSFYGAHNTYGYNVPRWLWVRHILI